MTFRIGILGSGNMGRTLGLRWLEQGYPVFFGARSPHQLDLVKRLGPPDVQTGTLSQAAAFGEVLLYTARGVPPSDIVAPELMAGKVLVDLNNFGIGEGYRFEPVTVSLAEQAQRDVPAARVVKAFNTLFMGAFELPPSALEAQRTATYLAGDDEAAKRQVAELARAFGLAPVDVGPLRQARLLESLADLLRLLMGGSAHLGPMAHLSVQVLPEPQAYRFGGMQASSLTS